MTDLVTADAPQVSPTGRMPLSPEAAATCLVCGSQVLAEGLEACYRHVVHDLGATYRQVNYWVMRGYLRPEHETPGPGEPRRWPAVEREVARRMARLTAAGLPAELAAVFARESWPAMDLGLGIRIEVRDGC